MADENSGEISIVAKFLQWTKKNRGRGERSMLYRGLASAGWEVEAGSYRRLRNSIARKNPRRNSQEDISQALFAEDNKRLLQKMRMEKYWEGSDLEILAKLQHDGAATCLIDFTIQPLVALWFACQPSSGKNKAGKVVATDREQYVPVTPENMDKREIRDFLRFENKKPKLWIWEPPGQNNNRIIAQYSVFVFGSPKISINKKDSYIIEEKNKKKILKELKNMGISVELLFRDYAGFILLNKHNEVYENWPVDGSLYSGFMNQLIGEHGLAIRCYDQVIKIDSENAKAYSNRGNAKRILKRYEEAIEDYDKAIKIDHEYVTAYNNRGIANSKLERNEEAMKDHDKAIKLDRENANAYGSRGDLNSKLGRNKEAIKDYNKAEKYGLNVAELYYDRCLCKNKVGNMKGAAADCRKGKKIASDGKRFIMPGNWEAKELASGSKRFRIPRKLKEYMKNEEGK